ncbi:hypothetical protein U27_06316 [Candidatus Vecturithrix granuli]|uniref:CRISPR type III-associated protein domain-containing protein n=1 Tax=Vecturithrix granuli TaxID=1499967 RepID=A0A081C427_VECG1|nr:hypothetical protein U27_06316 [Candidatus Vecturithrix granuli]
MHAITYTITTLAPVVIAARYGDMNLINTEQYLPGTSVLGLLAHRVLTCKRLSSAQALTDEHFYRWFLRGDLKIENAYIVSSEEHENRRIHFPTPISIHHEKHYDKRIHDLLYVDDDFREQTKHLGKFCSIERSEIYTKQVETELNFHHARDREKGRPREGMIFTYEAIAKDQTFQGEIRGKFEDLNAFIEVCKSDKFEWIAYIGRSKNAQYGQVKIELSEQVIKPEVTIQIQPQISLTLLSDAIVYNDWGFPTTDPDLLLQQYLPGAKTIKAVIKINSVENFISVWRLKKPSETCFAAGSTFLLDINACDVEQLSELEQTGIGERTHEGFGQCKFGWQVEENPVVYSCDESTENEESSCNLPEPQFPMPPKVIEILKMVAQDTFKKQAEWMALRELDGFKRRFPSSATFISRLQAIAKNSRSQTELAKTLSELVKRKPARDKLEACHNGEKTLFEFLSEHPNQIKTILRQSDNHKLRMLCHDIGYDAEADQALETTLFHLYFDTFFAMMRKQVAKGGK